MQTQHGWARAWRDNVFVERLWKSVNYERVYLHAYDSVTEARTSVMQYMDWYNHPDHIPVWAGKRLMRLMPILPTVGGIVRISRDST